jgi:hypothetical protein
MPWPLSHGAFSLVDFLQAPDADGIALIRDLERHTVSGAAHGWSGGECGIADPGMAFTFSTTFSGGDATSKMEMKSIERVSFSDAEFSLGNAKNMDLIPGRK